MVCLIIKLEYEDRDIVGIKTNYKNKVKNHYIRFIVDEFSIDKIIQEVKENKWVVALDYEGDNQYLFNLLERPTIPVIVTKYFEEVTELAIDYFVNSIPNWVYAAVKTPKTFSDMRMIEKISLKYPNVRFCGGKFLRLPTCKIGCIQREEIPSKVTDYQLSYYTEGCACALETMHLEDVEGIEFIYRDKEEEKEMIKEESKKKVLESLDDLFKF